MCDRMDRWARGDDTRPDVDEGTVAHIFWDAAFVTAAEEGHVEAHLELVALGRGHILPRPGK
jgi:hypothetical protein